MFSASPSSDFFISGVSNCWTCWGLMLFKAAVLGAVGSLVTCWPPLELLSTELLPGLAAAAASAFWLWRTALCCW